MDIRLSYEKLKNAKLVIAWLFVLVLIFAFYYIDTNKATLFQAGSIMKHIPFDALGSAGIATLFISFIYEYWVRKETYRELQNSLYTPFTVRSVISIETLHELVRTGLQRILGDDSFGDDIYNFVVNSTIIGKERRHKATTIVTILPLDREHSDEARFLYYDLIIDYDYLKHFSKSELVFECVDTEKDYNAFYDNASIEWRWFVKRLNLFPNFNPNFYKLTSCAIDDKSLDIKEINKGGGDVQYRVRIPRRFVRGGMYRINYRMQLKQRKFSHSFFLDIREPTKNVKFVVDFSKTDIEYMNVHAAFASPNKPNIQHFPSAASFHRIEISVDDWSIPQSGASFSWLLREEMVSMMTKKTSGESSDNV